MSFCIQCVWTCVFVCMYYKILGVWILCLVSFFLTWYQLNPQCSYPDSQTVLLIYYGQLQLHSQRAGDISPKAPGICFKDNYFFLCHCIQSICIRVRRGGYDRPVLQRSSMPAVTCWHIFHLVYYISHKILIKHFRLSWWPGSRQSCSKYSLMIVHLNWLKSSNIMEMIDCGIMLLNICLL